MKKRIHLFAWLIALALVALPTGAAFAQSACPEEGGVVYGRNCTIESGVTFDGDLAVFGGNVILEKGAELNGSLVVFGGTVTSDGEVSGDIAVFGGQVSLAEHAKVTGDVVLVGGQFTRAEGAVVEGSVVNNVQPHVNLPNAQLPESPVSPRPGINLDLGFNLFAQAFQILFVAVVAAGFAMLLSLFWKPQMERVGDAIVSQPLIVGAVGLLSVVVGALLILTIIPIFALGLAGLFGLVSLGSEIGERFAKAVNQSWPPVFAVGFGAFLLVLVGGALGFIPCIGGLTQFLLCLLAIGSVVVTRFGARSMQVPGAIVSAPAAPPTQS